MCINQVKQSPNSELPMPLCTEICHGGPCRQQPSSGVLFTGHASEFPWLLKLMTLAVAGEAEAWEAFGKLRRGWGGQGEGTVLKGFEKRGSCSPVFFSSRQPRALFVLTVDSFVVEGTSVHI